MPNIRRCCIVGCSTNSRDYPNLQFFQFPKPESSLYMQWRRACQASLSQILPFKKPVVCARHFYSKNIGGRRLVGSAVPALYLEVPSNGRNSENPTLRLEIEHSRKYAFINAVVYEWLVRANLNPSLRGSITHGMIKDKAIQANQLIDLESFVGDNRWLNKFRESHLKEFAAKLAANQLRPLNTSLWIPDIVKDLEKMFPPANIDRTDKLPDKYYQYLKQYDDYMEDSEQQQSNAQQQQQQQTQQQQQKPHNRHQQQQQQKYYNNSSTYLGPQIVNSRSLIKTEKFDNESTHDTASSPKLKDNYDFLQIKSEFEEPNSFLHSILDTKQTNKTDVEDDVELIDMPAAVQDLTADDDDEDDDDDDYVNENENDEQESVGEQSNISSITPSNNSPVENNIEQNVKTTSTAASSNCAASEHETISSYEAALEYLKPLEDFVLCKENFRGIGLLSQLEVILRRGVAANSGNVAK